MGPSLFPRRCRVFAALQSVFLLLSLAAAAAASASAGPDPMANDIGTMQQQQVRQPSCHCQRKAFFPTLDIRTLIEAGKAVNPIYPPCILGCPS